MLNLVTTITYIYWEANPDIFVIPVLNHPVRWYGVSWALGFLLSQQMMYFIYDRDLRPRKEVDTLTFYMIIAAILGARLGHLLFYDPHLILENPINLIATWKGGMASHGGAIGILIALYFFARKTQVPYLWIVDRLVIVSALTGGLIRLGNLMNSEMIGQPTDVPWAFVFSAVDDIPRHPAQLYEAIYCFILFALLFTLWYLRRADGRNGLLTGVFLVVLFTLRFIDEFFKVNQEAFEDRMPLNMGQILSIPFVIAGLVILIQSLRKQQDSASAS
jgi:phosphatidylglycerol---prolipoprotein diacylglyceryl transferase